MGLKRETAGRATLAVYLQVCAIGKALLNIGPNPYTIPLRTQIIFATILERIFLHFTPSILSVIGGVIILVSAVYVAVSYRRTSELCRKQYHLISFFQLSKTKALEKLPDRDPSSGQDEEAAIERGLLQGAGTNANYTKL